MVLRLFSGSVTPSSAPRNSSGASRWTRWMLKRSRKVCTTCSASPSRSRPWSTKMQVSWSPIAAWISTAATEESTPPDNPQMTRPVPTCSRMRAIWASRKPAMVQSPRQPATSWVKLRSNCAPCGVCTTSGWNMQAVKAAAVVGKGGERRALAGCDRRGSPAAARSPGRRGSSTPVRARRRPEPAKQRAGARHVDMGAAELAMIGADSTSPPSWAHIAIWP